MLEICPVLATFVIGWWVHNSGNYAILGLDVGYIRSAGVYSFVSLLVSGSLLIFTHHRKWGLVALGFALYSFLYFFVVIPGGYH